MANKLQLAAFMLGAVLCVSTALAKPPIGATSSYVPPAAQTDNSSTQNSNGIATPNATPNGTPSAADPSRRLSTQQRAAMRACVRNCIAAGMTGPFCSHSCIPD